MVNFCYSATLITLVPIAFLNIPGQVVSFFHATGSVTAPFTSTLSKVLPTKTPRFAPQSFTPPPDIRPALCLSAAVDKINQKAAQVQNILGQSTGQVESYYPESPCVAYQQRFQHGAIYYVSGATEAFETHADISVHYDVVGAGAIEFPVIDQQVATDGAGRFNTFSNGAIYWKPNLGAHALWGDIYQRWLSEGAEGNANWGYPITDEFNPNPSQISFDHAGDLMVSFENGVLYWDSNAPQTGVWELDDAA